MTIQNTTKTNMNIECKKNEIRKKVMIKLCQLPLLLIFDFLIFLSPIYLLISFIVNEFNALEWNIWVKILFSLILIFRFFSVVIKWIDPVSFLKKEYEKLKELEENSKRNDRLIQIIENTSKNNHFFKGNINIKYKK